MKKIKKILFPTDFSECANNAFVYTMMMADKMDADIEVLHIVFPETEPLDFPVIVTKATEARIEAARESMKAFVDFGVTSVVDQLKNVPNIQSDIEVGVPVSAIAQVAKRDQADLIIMGTEGENSALDKLIGSVAQGVLGKAECPILIIPQNARFHDIATIAYATDLQESDPFEVWKVTKLLEPYSPILRMVHVNDGRVHQEYERMADFKSYFADNSPTIQTKYHHLPGKKVVEELNEFADTYDVDIMVMYQPNRGFFDRLFHRSKTKQMSMKCQVPLLVVKA